MLSFPSVTKNAASNGLNLWLYTVLPAILPYTIVSSFLLHLDAFSIPCKIFEKIFKLKLPKNEIFIILCGLLCGCPIGAKLCADLYKTGQLKKNTADFLLCACNILSPSFLINYILADIYAPFIKLDDKDIFFIFLILLFSSFSGAFITCYLFTSKAHCKIKNSGNTNTSSHFSKEYSQKKWSLPLLFDKCVLSSFEIQTKIGGYIILFTIINNIFLYTLNLSNIKCAVLGSVLEVTSGMSSFLLCASVAATLPDWFIPSLIISLISFAGLCTLFQTKTVINGTNLSLRKYIISKSLSAIITFFTACIYFAYL